MKKIILLLTLVSLFSFNSKASHGVGGNIQFVQTGSNTYNVKMTLFRLCAGIELTATQSISIYDMNGCTLERSMTLTRDSMVSIDFGDECYEPENLCVEEHYFSGSITTSLPLANNPNGYRVSISISARNGVDNMAGGNLGLYLDIPDPALAGGNTSPEFVRYPTDGYFCIGKLKCIDFSATDADGDSLVYNLVQPVTRLNTTTCTFTSLAFRSTYNLNNILGPGSSCTIDAQTGCVWARPGQLGLYVISVRIDEYRNGIKIGQVIRDIQYYALNCSYNTLPAFANFPTLQALNFDKEGCFDIVAIDEDPEDTFFISISSNAFDFGATVSLPTPNGNGNYDFNWVNPTTGATDTEDDVNVVQINATDFQGVGSIGARFCWNLENCDLLAVDSFFVEAIGYSIGCDASKDTVRKRIDMPISKADYRYNVPNVFSPNGDGENDLFYLKKEAYDRCYDALNVRIYNRWGQLVFESQDPKFEWDGNDESGNPLSSGSYFVILQGYYGGEEVTQNFPLNLFR